MTVAGFSYAQARLHARLAARMAEPDWQQLEAGLDLGHVLELARRLPAARWTRRLTKESGVHAIEEVLRQEFSADIEEISNWLPRRWRPAAQWFGLLPYLREREFAASGEAAPAWMASAGEDAEAWDDPARIWRAGWEKRIGETGAARELQEALAPILSRFLDGGSAAMPWARLERHFLRTFRAGLRGPVAVFSYLGLDALDSERLRGILVGRAIFAGER